MRAESEKRIQQCKALFAEADQDGSGFLDEFEVSFVAGKLGLNVSDPAFVRSMVAEIEDMYVTVTHLDGDGSGNADPSSVRERGQVDVAEFTHWFMEIGVSYLNRPVYSLTVDFNEPSAEDIRHMFDHVDGDA